MIDHGYSFAQRGDHCANSEILRVRREHGQMALSDSELNLLRLTLEEIEPLLLKQILSDSRARSLRSRAQAMIDPPSVILREGAFH